jgi:hypothetical protein
MVKVRTGCSDRISAMTGKGEDVVNKFLPSTCSINLVTASAP